MPDVEIVAAVVRRGDQLLLVLQAGPGEEPFWAIPGGRVERGETPEQALSREVLEETGLIVLARGPLAYRARIVDRDAGRVHSVSTWEIERWAGELLPSDPDGFVRDVAWVPLTEAIDRLERVPWMAELVRYLRRSATA